ncbi:MAG: hypothetical protein GAK29_03554 [Acinetobacter bereziniae]|uniref:Uncharacterized protein n=1 Tax=Acinetobacter bereziniae TaxID=106648 RepID=A0A833PCD4_ACIBZ|nr:MAG: hypothetical protein GAK29_03554 [Acinetobacter bereziniae]
MILRICIALVFFITINVNAKDNLLTGEEISKKYKVVQSLNIPANYDNGMVLTMYAHIYRINVAQCVIVSRFDNESNFGGYESIVYFKKGIMLSSSKQSFFSIFLDDDAKIKSDQIKYGDYLNGKEVQVGLKEYFIEYRKKFNKKTLAVC